MLHRLGIAQIDCDNRYISSLPVILILVHHHLFPMKDIFWTILQWTY